MKNLLLFIILILFTTKLSSETINNKIENAYNSIYNSASLFPQQKELIQNDIKKEYETYKNLLSTSNKSSITIFYFVDSAIDDISIERFSQDINKIGITGKIMYRGLINNSFQASADFVKNIQKNRNIKNVDFYPIHFHSFEKFNLERVPAYALSICNNSQFKFNECEHKYLIKGDISLTNFFEIVKEREEEYSKYYYSLLE